MRITPALLVLPALLLGGIVGCTTGEPKAAPPASEADISAGPTGGSGGRETGDGVTGGALLDDAADTRR